LKKGDIVLSLCGRVIPSEPDRKDFGIVVNVDDSHRQTVVDVLWPTCLEKNIWERHLEVIIDSNT